MPAAARRYHELSWDDRAEANREISAMQRTKQAAEAAEY